MGGRQRSTTVISTKGQVILPKALRDERRWGPGTRLSVEAAPEGLLLKALPAFPATTVDAVFGSLGNSGKSLSIDDMNQVIAKEARRRARD